MPALVILGAPRSGTTLLYKALCMHPEVAYISNWVRTAPHLPDLAVLNRLARRLPGLRRRCWFGPRSDAYVYGHRRSLAQRLFPAPVEGEPVFRACGLPGDPHGPGARARPASRPVELAAVCARITARAGAPVFVTKRIAHNRRIEELAAALPTARFVEVVRDGRAVAHSLAQVDWWPSSTVWWYGGTPGHWAEAGGDPWELCARHWLEERSAVERGLSRLTEAEVHRLRYERLVADPLGTLAEVAAFAGLNPTTGWQRDLAVLEWRPEERWRWEMGAEARTTVERVQASALGQLGYA